MPIINDVLLLSERGEGVFTFRFKLSSHWWRIRDYYRTIFIPGSRTVCPFCHIHCILNKRQRQPKQKHRIDNPVTLATLSTKDEVNTKTNNTQQTNKLSNTDPNENTVREPWCPGRVSSSTLHVTHSQVEQDTPMYNTTNNTNNT